MPSTLTDGYKFEHKGRMFRARFPRDDDATPPWKRSDGHGPVSDWTDREPNPGERVLLTDRKLRIYYDYEAALDIALRDGWYPPPPHTGTRRDLAKRAVEADFEYLQRWCNDDWEYVGVVVTPIEPIKSLWGIESDAHEYLVQVATDLADEIVSDSKVGERDAQEA